MAHLLEAGEFAFTWSYDAFPFDSHYICIDIQVGAPFLSPRVRQNVLP